MGSNMESIVGLVKKFRVCLIIDFDNSGEFHTVSPLLENGVMPSMTVDYSCSEFKHPPHLLAIVPSTRIRRLLPMVQRLGLCVLQWLVWMLSEIGSSGLGRYIFLLLFGESKY